VAAWRIGMRLSVSVHIIGSEQPRQRATQNAKLELTVPRPMEGSLRPSERVNSVVGILFCSGDWREEIVGETGRADEGGDIYPTIWGNGVRRAAERVLLRGVFGEYPLPSSTVSTVHRQSPSFGMTLQPGICEPGHDTRPARYHA
jgi:hypothetical protein